MHYISVYNCLASWVYKYIRVYKTPCQNEGLFTQKAFLIPIFQCTTFLLFFYIKTLDWVCMTIALASCAVSRTRALRFLRRRVKLGPFTQNVKNVFQFHCATFILLFYINTLDWLVGHCACVLHLLPCLAHEHRVFKMQNFNFYTQCYSSISVPKQWTNQKTPEAGQAFVYSSKLATVLFGGNLVLHCAFLGGGIPVSMHILVAKMRSVWTTLTHCMSFFCWAQKKIFWRMLVTKQLMVAIDFHSIIFHTMEKACNGSQFGSYYGFLVTDQIIFRISKKKATYVTLLSIYYLRNTLKVIAHWVQHFFFLYSSSFPNKMLATDAKTQKIEPDPIFFFITTKASEAVCKCDWHNVRSDLFFNGQKFRTPCGMTFFSYQTDADIYI